MPLRHDVRILDLGAPYLAPRESLVLGLVLRALRDWTLVAVASPSLPLPRQSSPLQRPGVQVVSLLGSQAYAIEAWLAVAVTPAIPSLAVLVDPSLAALVMIYLQRSLTVATIQGVSVMTSPGLTVEAVISLDRRLP